MLKIKSHVLWMSITLCFLACQMSGVSIESTGSRLDQDLRVTIPDEFDAGFIDYIDMMNGPDPCDPNPCQAGALCEPILDSLNDAGLSYQCTSLSCADLMCAQDTRCIETGEGASCAPNTCLSSIDCDPQEYCDDQGNCQPERCTPDERLCEGATVTRCSPEGDEISPWVLCPLGEAQCVEQPPGQATCVCLDDWDCPSYLRCERGRCLGRAEAPTCLLPPRPFYESLPTPEITWGGTADNVSAIGSPFPLSSQAVMTPLVANLTDDNGDGIIDEGDTPEIIFMTFCGGDYSSNGALRAIHGGGPRKGKDLFVSVGDSHWYEGDDISNFNPMCRSALLDPTAGIAIANLDPAGSASPEPEIIGIHETDGVIIYNHRGEIISQGFVRDSPDIGPNPTPSIAQLDEGGLAEVIVSKVVYTFRREGDALIVSDQFIGNDAKGTNGQGGVSCVADINDDGRLEIIAGGSAYRFPRAPMNAISTADCENNGGQITPQGMEETSWCRGELITLWTARGANPSTSVPTEGFCAVADVWGADPQIDPGLQNPLDGRPEVVLISSGDLVILNGSNGRLIAQQTYGGSNDRGGAPNIGDFDGDGFPEVGSAFASGYIMMDLQTPSAACPEWTELIPDEQNNGVFDRPPRSPGEQCVEATDCAIGALCIDNTCHCAHQGWRRRTEDNSSKVTGSTLFDFNGDGAVEVIYNDECFFRIYDGSTGMTMFRQPSESRTRIEHPIVADVDADGNAEIVFTTSTESGFCSVRGAQNELGQRYSSLYNSGLEVWGDPQDLWVSARKIWNQHAYHVTHITESNIVPQPEPKGWSDLGGRRYNTYRAQPLSFGLAPDLRVSELRVSANREGCNLPNTGSEELPLNISLTLNNDGEVQVGSGVHVSFEAQWTNTSDFIPIYDPNGEPVSLFTQTILSADTSILLNTTYQPTLDPTTPVAVYGVEVPFQIKAIVDPVELISNEDFGRERECREDNNQRISGISISQGVPDLSVSIDRFEIDVCPEIILQLTLSNFGSVPVNRFDLGLYLGNPMGGGERIDRQVFDREIGAGESISIEWESDRFPEYREARLFVIVDPANQLAECSDDNNTASTLESLSCQVPDGK